MPAIITSGGTQITPRSLSDYSADQNGGAIVHPIVGRRDPDVTLRPMSLRTGSMVLDFASDADASNARTTLAQSTSWTLAHSERTSINMRFIVRRLGVAIRGGDGRYSITVGWEEVP